MRPIRALPGVLLAAGAVCVAIAVHQGGVELGLFVVVPFLIGTGPLFALGVLLVIGGLATLPLAWDAAPGPVADRSARAPTARSGGLVLIGPVPIFFGAWETADRRLYWLAAGVGLLLLVVVVLVGVALVR